MVFRSRGNSLPTIWVCSASVAVDTRAGLLLSSACAIRGMRYASDFPVPVPAWTSRWSPVSIARATCLAISCWPLRLCPPMPATARSSSSITNCSPGVVVASSATASVMGDEGFQFSREAFPDFDYRPGTGFIVVDADDLGVRFVQLADEVSPVVRDQQVKLDGRPRDGLADGL